MQDPHYPQHSEHDHSREEEHRDYGEQADQAVEGQRKRSHGFPHGLIRVQKIRSPEPQYIFHDEKYRRHDLNHSEECRIRAKLLKGLQHYHQNVSDDIRHEHIVEYEAWLIAAVTYL